MLFVSANLTTAHQFIYNVHGKTKGKNVRIVKIFISK